MTSDDAGEILASLRPTWEALLKRKYGSLREHYADFIQQASEEVLDYLHGPQRVAIEDWHAFGLTILKRRIYDHFRERARRWANEPITEELELSDPQPALEEVAHFARELRRVTALIAELEADDRRLILRGESRYESGVMSDADRKRLSRLRAQLRAKMGAGEERPESKKQTRLPPSKR